MRWFASVSPPNSASGMYGRLTGSDDVTPGVPLVGLEPLDPCITSAIDGMPDTVARVVRKPGRWPSPCLFPYTFRRCARRACLPPRVRVGLEGGCRVAASSG